MVCYKRVNPQSRHNTLVSNDVPVTQGNLWLFPNSTVDLDSKFYPPSFDSHDLVVPLVWGAKLRASTA